MNNQSIENPDLINQQTDFTTQTEQNQENPISKKTCPLKNHRCAIGFNMLILIGLIVLYVLHFSAKNNSTNQISGAIGKANRGSISVAFVNNDSILNNYNLVIKMRKELEEKARRLEGEVTAAQKAFEKDANVFKEHVSKKGTSDEGDQQIYAQLQQNQQKIYEMRDRYALEIQKSETEMNVVLLDSVMNFLHRYNQKYKFDYILGFTKGGNILYANDTLDITKNVIHELNAEYQSTLKTK